MIHKILKSQLLLLFLATGLSFLAFYFQGALPDNAFQISSSTDSVGFLSYSFFTFIAYFGYYLGPWIFLSFVLFALTYGLLFSARESHWDVWAAPLVVVFFALLGFYIYPEFLGQGLNILIKSYATDFSLITTIVLCLFTYGVIAFRGSFFEAVFSGSKKLALLPLAILSGVRKFQLVTRLAESKNKVLLTFNQLKINSRSFLKGDSKIALPMNSANELTAKNPEQIRETKKSTELSRPTAEIIKEKTKAKHSEMEAPPSAGNQEHQPPYVEAEVMSKPRKMNAQKDAHYHQIVDHFSQKQRAIQNYHPDDEYFHNIIQRIEEKLTDFGIDGKIINVLKGPVVDTFELETGPGVKASKINGIQDDLTMALKGAPIRIVYPMPQRTTIGVEVPRDPRDVIFLHEVLQSSDFSESNYRLPVAMGKNSFGETFVVDLAAMPHMLVAGATGAGKSVFINTLLVSLLVKRSPQEMKLILIDPKQLELALYSTLPHLVMPVLTEPKKSAIALLWAVEEMERRYSILKELGVRNIEGFNKKIENANPAMLAKIRHLYQNEPDDEGYAIPYLVIIVDEFADLILTKAGKEIENYICRLAAKARASGIHLVLATQRPSVDVVTGLIKSNFPTRVSFRVTTNADSRTILDSIGAEKLLGKGDMLYRNGTETTRVHSSYVDEAEIEVLVEELAELPGTFHDGAMEFLENGGAQETVDEFAFGSHLNSSLGGSSTDDLFQQAIRVVVEQRAASASMLQRRLKIGYNRAANLIDELEAKGIVGPAQGAKPRSVLMSSESEL